MLTYWLMFLIPAVGAIMAGKARSGRRLEDDFLWMMAFVCLSFLIGFRHEVGGDWSSYEGHYKDVSSSNFLQLFSAGDPGYYVTLWVVSLLDLGVHYSNLVFGALFSAGLVAFCKSQPRPWLALAISVPYMVIVLGMGYTRQGVAMGLSLLGFVALSNKNTKAFVAWVACAAMFHKSAVLLIPLGVLATPRSRFLTISGIVLTFPVLYLALLADSVDDLVKNYIDAEYSSEGAAIRVAMNIVPACILLLRRKRLDWHPAERNLWLMLSILAFVSAGWLAISPSSTAVDRVALYLIPLQIYVFSRLPDLMMPIGSRQFWIVAPLAYYALVLFIWLSFASHADFWVPYKFYPLVVV